MLPKIVKSISEMKSVSAALNGSIGFVPTMGYLHEGHLSLVRASKAECDFTIVSIYVNPSQFGENEDLSSYPRDFDNDIKLLSDLDVDIIFFPSNDEMYPIGFKTWIVTDEITNILCGKSRPNHFKGVTTIVAKLVNIVKPQLMLMGEKDFQQIVVLETMLKDLNFECKICRCGIVRESDGLAMSSRNKYLNTDDRKKALCLSKSLKHANMIFKSGNNDTQHIKKKISQIIKKSKGEIDYIEIVDSNTLQPVGEIEKGNRILLAVKIGKTRLIDNAEVS